MIMSIRYIPLVAFLLVYSLTSVMNAQDPLRDKLVVETLIRLKRFDVSDNEKLRGSVVRHMESHKNTPKYVELARLFSIEQSIPELLALATEKPTANIGVDAMNTAISIGGIVVFEKALSTDDTQRTVALLQAAGQSTDPITTAFLLKYYKSAPRNRQVLTATALAITRTTNGQRYLLKEAEAGRLPAELTFAVGNALYNSADSEIQARAKASIKLPATADFKQLPPIKVLLSRRGDPQQGKTIFFTKGTCVKCHKVNGQGKEVGPGLSEIGSKLSRDALYTSILDPSAGISHNYETYSLITIDGNIITGIKINDTDTEITLRTAEGIDKTTMKSDVDELIKTGVSLMPADLQRLLSVQELVDIVAYLATLTKN